MAVFASRQIAVPRRVATISFTIAGTKYQAEEGMTWAEFMASDYNTDGIRMNGSEIYYPPTDGFIRYSDYSVVGQNDEIISEYTYQLV